MQDKPENGGLREALNGAATRLVTLDASDAQGCRRLLAAKGIQAAAADAGKDYGRTAVFNPVTGEVSIKSLKFGLQKLYPR